MLSCQGILVKLYTSFLFQLRYAHNPLSLYQTVQQCLNSEMHLVQRSEGIGVSSDTAMANDTIYQVRRDVVLSCSCIAVIFVNTVTVVDLIKK